jgi:hypothetical protein
MTEPTKKRLSEATVTRILSWTEPAPAGHDTAVWLAFQDFIRHQYETKGYAETYCACGDGDCDAPARRDRIMRKVRTVIATGYDMCDSFLAALTHPYFIRMARFVASLLGIVVGFKILIFFFNLL